MTYHHILVPVDGSKISFSAVQYAAKIAQAFNSQLTLISLIAGMDAANRGVGKGAGFCYNTALHRVNYRP